MISLKVPVPRSLLAVPQLDLSTQLTKNLLGLFRHVKHGLPKPLWHRVQVR